MEMSVLPDEGGPAASRVPEPVPSPPASSRVIEPEVEMADIRIDDVEDVDGLRHHVDNILSRVDQLEQRANEVAQFYASKKQPVNSKGRLTGKEKDKTHISNTGNHIMQSNNVGKQEAACSKRMQELMRQFGTILRQIAQHKWAWPFMEPVEVDCLGLHDYNEVIKKPMDFSTIKNRMEAKDGTGYKNVREIYADARLVFTNAMTYNDEKNDFHVMARALLEKLEEKWLQLLSKVIEEEKRQKEEEDRAQKAAVANLARDTNDKLNDLSLHLEELREMVVQKCRKISAEEKRKMSVAFGNLSAEDISKVLEVVSRINPNVQPNSESVEIDLDDQGEAGLWKLKFFLKDLLELRSKNSPKNSPVKADEALKQKEICDALAKTAKKQRKLPLS